VEKTKLMKPTDKAIVKDVSESRCVLYVFYVNPDPDIGEIL